MKKKSLIILAIIFVSIAANAKNRWNIQAGGNLSHQCETPVFGTDKTYSWGGGAFIGGGYEISFNSHWSLNPQLEISYVNNGGTLSSEDSSFYFNHANWLSTWNLNIPIVMSYRFNIDDDLKLRFGAGPYLQEALAGRRYKNDSTEKEKVTGNICKRFNVGFIGETAIETGSHISYVIRAQYPFLTEGWVKNTLTLSAGIRYSF
jgi:hypothetical protein